MNTNKWTVTQTSSTQFGLSPNGGNESAGLNDMWNSNTANDDYKFGCDVGSLLVMARGIEVAMGQAFDQAAGKTMTTNLNRLLYTHNIDSKLDDSDWVPGEWGWIRNNRSTQTDPLHWGENVIYCGGRQVVGDSPVGRKAARSLANWVTTVTTWGQGTQTTITGKHNGPLLGLTSVQ